MAGVILSSGRVLNANLVIGADGARSVVRRAIVGHEESLESTGLSCYTFVFFTCLMRQNVVNILQLLHPAIEDERRSRSMSHRGISGAPF